MSDDRLSSSFMDEAGPQDPLDAFLEEHFDRMRGEALDTAVELRADIDGKGPFWQFIEHSRREAADALATIVGIDPANTRAVAEIQSAVRLYSSALAFAQKLIRGYSPPDSDSADEAGAGVGEPL